MIDIFQKPTRNLSHHLILLAKKDFYVKKQLTKV
nr:MAG TPA: hypothetical protein [Caudoviricetes sp.]